MTQVRFSVFLIASLLAASCTQSPSAAKRKYFASGSEYFRQNKYPEAAIQFSAALQKDPLFGDALFGLAEAYMAQGDVKHAFAAYIRAADLLPDNAEAQVKAGRLLVNGGYFQEAKARARAVLKRDPSNVDALLILGNALAGLKSFDDAVGVAGRAVQVDPERAGVYSTLGVFQLAHGETDLAEKAFAKAVELSPSSVDALLNLGTFYRAVRRLPDAEQAFKRAYKLEPAWVRVNQSLALLYLDWQRTAQAEPYLKAIGELSKDPKLQFALADYYTGLGRPADAVKTLSDLALDKANYADAQTRIALIRFVGGDHPAAHRIVDEVLRREPRNAGALTVKARLLLAENRNAEALERAKLASDLDSRSPDTQLALARTYRALDRIEDARKGFNDTLKLDPHSLPAQLELAEIHRSRNEIDSAIQFAQLAADEHRDSVPARLSLIRILMIREQDYPHAENELRNLLARAPNTAQAHALTGALWLAKKDQASATRSFGRALDLDPASAEALTGLISIDLAHKNPQMAIGRIERYLTLRPNAPGPLLIAARLYGLIGDQKRLESTLKRALNSDSSNPEIYDLLGQFYVSHGRLKDAEKQFTEIARLEPRSVAAATMLGWLSYANRNFSAAQEWWEKALRIDSGAAAAANNLAWFYAENGGNLDVALQLAQTAKGKYSGRPEVNDTLGWVYCKKNLNSQAIFYLRQSVEQDSNNPVYQYHLGTAYAQNGEDAKARRLLERALALRKDFEGAAEARKVLATLVY
jgi:putative PEP-CTERM system TPR-repeat lipoprotein